MMALFVLNVLTRERNKVKKERRKEIRQGGRKGGEGTAKLSAPVVLCIYFTGTIRWVLSRQL